MVPHPEGDGIMTRTTLGEWLTFAEDGWQQVQRTGRRNHRGQEGTTSMGCVYALLTYQRLVRRGEVARKRLQMSRATRDARTHNAKTMALAYDTQVCMQWRGAIGSGTRAEQRETFAQTPATHTQQWADVFGAHAPPGLPSGSTRQARARKHTHEHTSKRPRAGPHHTPTRQHTVSMAPQPQAQAGDKRRREDAPDGADRGNAPAKSTRQLQPRMDVEGPYRNLGEWYELAMESDWDGAENGGGGRLQPGDGVQERVGVG